MKVGTRPLGMALTVTMTLLLGTARLHADGPGGLTGEELASDGVLYSVDRSTGELITIDPNTAAIEVVGPVEVAGPVSINLVEGLTYHAPTDSLLAIDVEHIQLVSIDRYTGAAVVVGPLDHPVIHALTYSEHNDTLYGFDSSGSDLLRIDPNTGASESVGPLPYTSVRGLSDNPETGVLYGIDDPTDAVFVADLEGGLTGGIVELTDTWMQGVAYDSTTGDLFVLGIEVGPEQLVRIDPLTDAVGVVGLLEGVSLGSLEFVPHGVPEPTSLAAVSLATLAMACLGRRRR